MSAPQHITLFGVPSLSAPDGERVLGPGKPLALLAYLLLRGPTTRDKLVSIFWSAQPEKSGRNAFRQSLHRLRSAGGDDVVTDSSGKLKVDGSALYVDVFAFEAAVARKDVDEALKLYGGPFFDGPELGEPQFDQWVLSERTRLQARHNSLLSTGVTRAMDQGDAAGAAVLATQYVESEPLSEEAAIGLASALIALDRPNEAFNALESFLQRYDEDIGTAPSERVVVMLGRLRKSATSGDIRARARPKTFFAGREQEIVKLLGIWNQVSAGNGRAVSIVGPEGIGKSALCAEFLARIPALGPALVLRGEEPSGAVLPFASIGGALRGALDAPGLSGASQHLLAEAARLLPALRDQFDLPDLQPIADDTSKLRFYEGVAALIDAVAYEQPVCIVLDDFHNADQETRDLLRYLSGRLSGVAVLFVILTRKGSRAGNDFPAVTITLDPLSIDQAEQIISAIAGDDLVSAADRRRFAALSGGVPFKAVDIARQAAGGMNPSAVPATVKDSLWARLQGCVPSHQRIFVASALVEKPLSIRQLAACAHVSEIAALDSVIALESLGLLVETPAGVKPSHDVAAALALEATGMAGRALLAGWAADAMAADGGMNHGELAQLYKIAGNREGTFAESIAAAYEAGITGSERTVHQFIELAKSSAANADDQKAVRVLEKVFARAGAPALGSGESPAIRDEQIGQASAEGAQRRISHPAIGQIRTLVSKRGYLLVAGLSVVAILLAWNANGRRAALPGPVLPDTLYLFERTAAEKFRTFAVSGPIVLGATDLSEVDGPSRRTWMDSLSLPWLNARLAPDGQFVAVERIDAGETDVYLFSPEGKELRKLVGGPGDDIIAGWSPDGKWLLVTRGETRINGEYDSNLFAFSVTGRESIALDTASTRSVTDAVWSPEGTSVAWVARVGETHQQEIFIADADGSNVRNISNHPAEDYRIEWAPDGGRVSLTSERAGNAEIFAYELATEKLWRVTWDPAHDDHAVFSPDGNFLAFESTRGGQVSVYVVRSWGGAPTRISSGTRNMRIRGWGGLSSRPSYITQLAIRGRNSLGVGDTALMVAEGIDRRGNKVSLRQVRWQTTGATPVRVTVSGPDGGGSHETGNTSTMIGMTEGVGKIVVSAGGWRTDTVTVRVGRKDLPLMRADFENGIDAATWTALGDPPPGISARTGSSGSAGLSASGNRQWESGILSRDNIQLSSGVYADAWIDAPLASPTGPRSFTISFVAPEDSGSVDARAPRFLKLASVEWIGAAARISYSVESEIWTEPVSAIGKGTSHVYRMHIEPGGRVAFFVDGKLRWRSTVLVTRENTQSRLWVATQGTQNGVTFDDISVVQKYVEPRQD